MYEMSLASQQGRTSLDHIMNENIRKEMKMQSVNRGKRGNGGQSLF
jgi:hypothetical protein